MRKKFSFFVLCVVAAAATAYLVTDITITKKMMSPNSVSSEYQSQTDKKSDNARRLVTSNVPNFSDAAESAVDAVVYVKVVQKAKHQQTSSLFDLLFGFAQTPKDQVGLGSGVIIDPDGYIVTNNHVIAGADIIEVTLENNRIYRATLVGTDPATDIALLKIEEHNLPAIPLGNSDDLRLGEWVLAIGSPYDLRSTITAGIVSAKGRSLPNYDGQYRVESFIQTDAAVNPGNSGGALVNAVGELVGINTSIISLTGSYSGYSFAVPVNIVKKITDDFRQFGEVRRAMLGISITDITANIAAQANLEEISGVYVADVQRGGVADRAGINTGDVIVELGLNKVQNSAALQEQMSKLRPGEQTVVTVIRNGSRKEFIVSL